METVMMLDHESTLGLLAQSGTPTDLVRAIRRAAETGQLDSLADAACACGATVGTIEKIRAIEAGTYQSPTYEPPDMVQSPDVATLRDLVAELRGVVDDLKATSRQRMPRMGGIKPVPSLSAAPPVEPSEE